MEARARADAIEQRGEAYFDEWMEELSSKQDEAARRATTERLAGLRQQFTTILAESRQLRQQFRKFLDGLRSMRASLSKEQTRAALDRNQPPAGQVVSDGLSAQQAMDRLLITLEKAKTAVRSMGSRPSKSGGNS